MTAQLIRGTGRLLATVALLAVLLAAARSQVPMASASLVGHPNSASVDQYLADLNDVNYYPSGAAQTHLWTNWQGGNINADFARLAAMGANTVRIGVFSSLGFPLPPPLVKSRLAQIIRLAGSHRLRVQLTLFGFLYRFDDIAGSEEWARALLQPYRHDHRIAFVDVYNEINTQKPQVMAWARALVPYIRGLLPGVPLTTSVSGVESVAGLRRLKAANIPVDFYDLHYYGPANLAHATFQAAREAVDGSALFIGEEGRTSYRSNTSRYTSSWWEATQSQYHRTVQAAARALHLPAPAPWIYSDFRRGAFPPGSTAGTQQVQYAFGLVRADGTLKASGSAIERFFLHRAINTGFNNGFEGGDGTGVPDLWLIQSPGQIKIARDVDTAHAGSASVRLQGSTGHTQPGPGVYVSPVITVLPNQLYTARVWAKGTDATGVTQLRLTWRDASGKYVTTARSKSLQTGTSDWTRLSVTARAPETAALLEIHLTSANNSGSVWFDDVSLFRNPQHVNLEKAFPGVRS